MVTLMFLAGISWVYHYSAQNPKPINKASGYQLQRFAPSQSSRFHCKAYFNTVIPSVLYRFSSQWFVRGRYRLVPTAGGAAMTLLL